MAGEEPEVPAGEQPNPAVAPDTAGDTASETASGETGAFDKQAYLSDLKSRLGRGELSAQDVAEHANPRLQSVASTLAGKFDRLRERSERMGSILTDKGAKLPEGKTPFDLLTDPDPSGFVELMESLPTMQAQRARLSNEEIINAQRDGILEGLKQFPDLKPDMQQIADVIVSDPVLNQIANSSPEYMPLLMAGVGRDIQKARGDLEIKRLGQENTELRDALRKAGIVARTGGESSKVKATAPNKAPAETPADVRSIAASVLERIKSGQISVQ